MQTPPGAENWFSGHGWQVPPSEEEKPAGHLKQLVDFISEDWPTGHGRQIEPSTLENVPAEQSIQAVFSGFDVIPGGQPWHSLPEDMKPFKHLTHPPVSVEKNPGLQLEHFVWSSFGTAPKPHGLHIDPSSET